MQRTHYKTLTNAELQFIIRRAKAERAEYIAEMMATGLVGASRALQRAMARLSAAAQASFQHSFLSRAHRPAD